MSFYDRLVTVLSQDARLVSEKGELLRNAAFELGYKLDTELLHLLLADEETRRRFFTEVDGILVFDKQQFGWVVSNREFLPDSYTRFRNAIGLADGRGRSIAGSRDVELVWPFKDCVLEGGQEKEDERRDEVFYNETLAPDQIDRLLAPKVLANARRYSEQGVVPTTGFSLDDNLVVRGNNLLVLHSLLPRYRGKVKLCYADPPYNTGNDGFGYNDRFNQSSWLTFMKNRLTVARDLLRDDGTIAISIAQNEVAYLLVLMDEVFGPRCRRNIITVRRASATGAKVINPGVINISEFIVLYCKDPEAWKPGRVFREKDRDTRYNKVIVNPEGEPEQWRYASALDAFAESQGVPKSKLRAKLGDAYDEALEDFFYSNAERVIRFGQLDPTQVSQAAMELKATSIENPGKTFILQREGKSTRYIHRGEVILFFKDRLVEVDGKRVFGEPITDIWDDVLPNDLHNEGGVSFRKGKKPEKLIGRLVELTTKRDELVLDFFLGSGTTAGVCHKLGRTYVGVEQLAYGDNDSVSRLKNTVAGEQSGISRYADWTGGGSFVYCELKELNEAYVEKVQLAKTTEELLAIWVELRDTGLINYRVIPDQFNLEKFRVLSFEEQQRLIAASLEKNRLYVNHCDIDDADYEVNSEDKAFNASFYGTFE